MHKPFYGLDTRTEEKVLIPGAYRTCKLLYKNWRPWGCGSRSRPQNRQPSLTPHHL